MAKRVIKRLAHDWLLQNRLCSCYAEAKNKVERGLVFFNGVVASAHVQYTEPEHIIINSAPSTAVTRTPMEWLLESGLVCGPEEARRLIVFGKVRFDGIVVILSFLYKRPKEIWVLED